MKFRKKPIIIEAFQYDGDLMNSEGEYYVPEWATDAFLDDTLFYDSPQDKNEPPYELYVSTLEGDMLVRVNDYVIQGVNGEIYPCKPDIFEKTYEKVEE
jgi:hypothetical protein